jgi:hypothetical protein
MFLSCGSTRTVPFSANYTEMIAGLHMRLTGCPPCVILFLARRATSSVLYIILLADWSRGRRAIPNRGVL